MDMKTKPQDIQDPESTLGVFIRSHHAEYERKYEEEGMRAPNGLRTAFHSGFADLARFAVLLRLSMQASEPNLEEMFHAASLVLLREGREAFDHYRKTVVFSLQPLISRITGVPLSELNHAMARQGRTNYVGAMHAVRGVFAIPQSRLRGMSDGGYRGDRGRNRYTPRGGRFPQEFEAQTPAEATTNPPQNPPACGRTRTRSLPE
jgi:hypothetical protein